ncbi:MAG: DUF2157 domain-containing protein [Verrucomicrobia bacterium]|nr:DUF2157 domain-containing protein [Prolixibacteraceae bacterium]
MSRIKDLDELVEAAVINQETADRINFYYQSKSNSSTSRLFIVFAIFGALLTGLGFILIIAHNWDELSRATKTGMAFMPLVAGQFLCGYVLMKKQNSIAWRESTTTFLIFAVGAVIALISQIYNIPGNLSSFLLTWTILCFPLIYIMKSSLASLLFIIGITSYACVTSYFSYPREDSYLYWLLLAGALPHYYQLYKEKPQSNFMVFHHWIIPLSIIITLGTVAKTNGELMFIAYFSLLGLFYMIGDSAFFSPQKPINNGYKIIGTLGTLILLLSLSFDDFWEKLIHRDFPIDQVFTSPEFIAAIVLSFMAAALFYFQYKNKPADQIKPIAYVFMLFIATYLLGLYFPFSVVLINLCVFLIGLLTMREGSRMDHLGVLNLGLLIIIALVICRFLDTDLSFVLRGIMFLIVGAGFFATNYIMLKKRNKND